MLKLPHSERCGIFERSPLEIVSLKAEVEIQRHRYESVNSTFGPAVDAALSLIAEVESLNVELAREGAWARMSATNSAGLQRLGVRIGLHYGRVVVGNLGNEQRTDYAVIGDVVNTAARLEALNKTLSTRILLSDALRSELVDEGVVSRLQPLGVHRVKGREQGVEVFTVQ